MCPITHSCIGLARRQPEENIRQTKMCLIRLQWPQDDSSSFSGKELNAPSGIFSSSPFYRTLIEIDFKLDAGCYVMEIDKLFW